MRKAVLLAFIASLGCADETCKKANVEQLALNPGPLECVLPLGPTQYEDGTPWPTYTEKLAEFEACRDGEGDLTGTDVSVNECADGKTLLSLGGGFYSESYYFQGQTLVGYESGGDILRFDCDACALPRPQGTRESITCDVVSTRAIDCSPPEPLAVLGSCRAQTVQASSIPGADAPSSSEACTPGSTRCNGRFVQRCQSDGTQWASVKECETAALCGDDGVDGAFCTPPVCAAGQTCCDGAVRQRCNDDGTNYEQIEMCASADRCTPVGCM